MSLIKEFYPSTLLVKVGGMRVPLPKHVHEEKPAEVGASKEGAEANSDVAK